MSLTVTVRDNETGDTASAHVPDHDYFLVVTGECYLAHSQTHINGTHVLTIKGRRDTQPAALAADQERADG